MNYKPLKYCNSFSNSPAGVSFSRVGNLCVLAFDPIVSSGITPVSFTNTISDFSSTTKEIITGGSGNDYFGLNVSLTGSTLSCSYTRDSTGTVNISPVIWIAFDSRAPEA